MSVNVTAVEMARADETLSLTVDETLSGLIVVPSNNATIYKLV